MVSYANLQAGSVPDAQDTASMTGYTLATAIYGQAPTHKGTALHHSFPHTSGTFTVSSES